jgi:hypothetical protein
MQVYGQVPMTYLYFFKNDSISAKTETTLRELAGQTVTWAENFVINIFVLSGPRK